MKPLFINKKWFQNKIMKQELLKLEAVLFAYGKLVTEEELNSVLNTKNLKKDLKDLKEEYSKKDTSLHLTNSDGKWKLTVKDDFMPLVKNIITKTELDRGTMETLAVIAFKYPVLQSEVINLRNASAYEHIKQLMEYGYVTKEKHGRSYKLKLTPKFFEYFDLPEKKVKEFFSEYTEVEKIINEKEEEARQLEKELKKKQEEAEKIHEAQKENQKLNEFSKKEEKVEWFYYDVLIVNKQWITFH